MRSTRVKKETTTTTTDSIANGGKRKGAGKKGKSAGGKKSKKDEDFEVEAVRGIKVEKGVTYYLIKWTGYAEGKNSWEPASNVASEVLVREFLLKSLTDVPAASDDEEEKAEEEEKVEADDDEENDESA